MHACLNASQFQLSLLSTMASKMNYNDIVKRVKERKAAFDAKQEAEIDAHISVIDDYIGEIINRATNMPITCTYPHALNSELMKTAWNRLSDKYQAIFGPKCQMTIEYIKSKEYDGKGDEWESTKAHGKFTLTE